MGVLMSTMVKAMTKAGEKVEIEFEKATMNPKLAQEELLEELVACSKDSLLGKNLGLSDVHCAKDLQEKLPLTDYDYYLDYVEKIAAGEKNVLSNREVIHLSVTSGTLGVPKRIPINDIHVNIFADYFVKYFYHIATRDIGTKFAKGKGLCLAEGNYEFLPSGISVGCASSVQNARMDKVMPIKVFDVMDLLYTSPKEARKPIVAGSYTRYLHARFAMMEENITSASITFSSLFLELMRYIDNNAELIINDIEQGTISDEIDMPAEVRESVSKRLKPMPKRAKALREIFAKKDELAIGSAMWPDLDLIFTVGGDGFKGYTDKLVSKYFGGKVHVIYFGISASEAFFSIPVAVDDMDSVLVPNAGFMEFIPIVDGERDLSNGIKLMHELELGKQYEIVVTNQNGFFRYQMKDVIEVTGFYHKTPKIQFVNRSGFAVNMYAEKTSHKALLHTAVETANALGLDLVDYIVCPFQDENSGRYIMMYEFSDDVNSIDMDALQKKTEEQLMIDNPRYKAARDKQTLKPLEVKVLQPQTFLLYKDIMIMKGTSAAQLKPVHVTNNPFQEKFFLGLVEK